MDNFNYKKYLAESKLFEEMSFDDDIENKTNKNDFAFWYRSGARGKAQALKAKDLLTKNGIDADYSKGPFYIDFSNAGVEERVIQQMLRDANLDRFVILRDKKDLAEGELLKENAPGYDSRKFGEALPTLESVKAAHEAKEDDKKEIKEEEGFVEVSQDEVKMHLKQYRDGMIDGDDLANAIEEIVVGKVLAPGVDKVGGVYGDKTIDETKK